MEYRLLVDCIRQTPAQLVYNTLCEMMAAREDNPYIEYLSVLNWDGNVFLSDDPVKVPRQKSGELQQRWYDDEVGEYDTFQRSVVFNVTESGTDDKKFFANSQVFQGMSQACVMFIGKELLFGSPVYSIMVTHHKQGSDGFHKIRMLLSKEESKNGESSKTGRDQGNLCRVV